MFSKEVLQEYCAWHWSMSSSDFHVSCSPFYYQVLVVGELAELLAMMSSSANVWKTKGLCRMNLKCFANTKR